MFSDSAVFHVHRRAPARARTLSAPAFRLSALLWMALCLVLAGCGTKQIAVGSEEGQVISGSQKNSVYLPPDDGKALSPEEMDALISVGDFDRTIRGEDMLDVVLHFKYYLHQGRRTVEKNVERGELYLPYIRSTLKQKRLPGDLAYLPFIESGYDNQVRSRTGALGMWQFVRGTGDAYGMRRDWWSDERHCPYQSTEAAAEYLTKLYAQFKDWHLAITAYNAGEGRVSRALSASGTNNFFDLRRRNNQVPEKDRLTDENKQYLPRFIAVAKIMRNLKALGFPEPKESNAREVSEVSIRPGTDLKSMSRKIGMNWNEFCAYNPAYLRYVSPPNRATKVFVPPRLSAEAAAFARNPGKEDSGWNKYTVQKGDTFTLIASRTGIPAAELRRANPVSEPLKAGRVLRIPGGGSAWKPTAVAEATPEPARESAREPARAAQASGRQPAAAAQASREYTVRSGDTAYSLARAWNTTPDAIIKANKLSGSSLSVGQKLSIPGSASAQSPDSDRDSAVALALAQARTQAEQPSARAIAAKIPPSGPAASQTTGKTTAQAAGKPSGQAAQSTQAAKPAAQAAQSTQAAKPAAPAKDTKSAADAKNAKSTPQKAVTYKVQPGDTVWAIARKFDMEPATLMRANNLTSKSTLKPGDTVRVR